MIYGTPIAILLFLVLFAGILLPWQAKSVTDRGGDTKEHSERIYKDFEMYLKVTLGLVAAFGYIRLDKFTAQPELARQALQVVGGVSLLVMTTFCVFIICHQASKVRRWKNIEWAKAIFWQEAMGLFSNVALFLWSLGCCTRLVAA